MISVQNSTRDFKIGMGKSPRGIPYAYTILRYGILPVGEMRGCMTELVTFQMPSLVEGKKDNGTFHS